VKLADAFDDDAGRTGAQDARAHLVQAVGDVDNFRLAGSVGDDGGALGQGRRHDGDMGAAHRHFGKVDCSAPQAARRLRDHVAAVDGDIGAEFLQRHDQQIDRPGADGAAPGQRHPGLVHSRQERRNHPETGAHPRHQLIGRGGIDDVGRRNMQGLALIFVIAGPLSDRGDIDAVIAENTLQLGDVGEPRHVVEDQRLFGQKPRDHQRQRRIFSAGDRNGAVELVAADDANAIHAETCLLLWAKYRANAAPVAKSLEICGYLMGTAVRGD
jgi:hypothetical protein